MAYQEGVFKLLQSLSRPKPMQQEERKQRLKDQLRRHIETVVPEVDESESSFQVAERLARRASLVDRVADCMADYSMGFHFKQQMEPEWRDALTKNKCRLFQRAGKIKTRIYMPGFTREQCVRTMKGKPYFELEPKEADQ